MNAEIEAIQRQIQDLKAKLAQARLKAGPEPVRDYTLRRPDGSGALWFDAASAAFAWQAPGELMPVARTLADGSLLRGVSAELVATGGPLEVREAIIGSIRVIRNYQDGGEAPAREVSTLPARSGSTIVWQRRRLVAARATTSPSRCWQVSCAATSRSRSYCSRIARGGGARGWPASLAIDRSRRSPRTTSSARAPRVTPACAGPSSSCPTGKNCLQARGASTPTSAATP